MDAVQFLSTIFQYAESGYTQVFALPSATARAIPVADFTQVPAAIAAAGQQNIYFSPGISSTSKNSKLAEPDITGITAFWADVDILDSAHAKKNLPRSVEEAMTLIPNILPPSIIVHSGHGLQFWWLLREGWCFDTPEEKKRAKAILERLQQYIRKRALAKNWHLDSVHDLCRVMRLPGTWNVKIKDQPVLAQVIESSDIRYNPDDIDSILPVPEAVSLPDVDTQLPETATLRTTAFERRPTDGPASFMLQNCMFMQHWRLNYKTLAEPEWMAAIANVVRGVDGEAIVVETARAWLGEKYNHDKTMKKIQHAIEDFKGPYSCDYIQKHLGFQGCPQGGCGIQAPCGWSLGKIPQAKAIVRSIAIPSADTVFRQEVIGALAVLEKEDKLEHARIRNAWKGRVNLNDLNAAVKAHRKEHTQLQVIEGGQQQGALQEGQSVGAVTTCSIIPDSPLDLNIPASFSYGDNGVYLLHHTQDNKTVQQRASGVPVIISERIYNLDTGIEKVEIAFRYYNYWRKVSQARSTVFNSRQITKLTDYGLNTSSESAKYLVKYLEALESANHDRIPLRHAVTKIGWREQTGEFVLPADGKYMLDMDDEGEVVGAFVQRGNFEQWLAISHQVRTYPVARFVLAASLATPLLNAFKHRNFLIYFWGTSGGGKTASLIWALSAWGVPQRIMVSFLMTQSGLERRLSLTSDLPTGINERQAAGGGRDKQEYLERIVYMLEGGKGKVRASKTGVQKTASWRTIGLASGEEPLTKETSIQGVKTRVLEINSYPVIGSDEFAKSLYSLSEEHCGHAGPAFVRRLMEELTAGSGWIREAYAALQQLLTADYPQHFTVHIDAVACVALADFLASQWLFGQEKSQAEQESYELANYIMQQLPTQAQISDVERGWDFVQNWLAANHSRFESDINQIKAGPVYGFKKSGQMYIYPEPLTAAMEDAGFSPDKLLREFANNGRIDTAMEAGMRRFKVRVRYNNQNVRVIKISDVPSLI